MSIQNVEANQHLCWHNLATIPLFNGRKSKVGDTKKVIVKYDIKKRSFNNNCKIKILSLLLAYKINQSGLFKLQEKELL